MAFQSVPATAEAVVQMLQNTVIVSFSMYAKQAVAYDSDLIQDLADATDSWMATELLPFLSNQVSYTMTNVRGLESENDVERSQDAGAGIGGIAAVPLPNNIAFVVKRLSGLTGRSARGRVYVPGIPVTAQSSNENFVGQTFADDILGAFNDFATYLSGTGWTPVIVSRYTAGAKRLTGVTFPVVNWEYTDFRLDSRRDRFPGV